MQSLVLRKKEDFSVGLFVPQTEFIPCALSGQRALYVRLKRNFEEVPGRQKERANWILHPLLIYTYEKAVCQVKKLYNLPTRDPQIKKLYNLPTRDPQIGLIAKHLSVFTQRCHTIMHLINGVPITLSASPFMGHVN
jgi:hypothetical protein